MAKKTKEKKDPFLKEIETIWKRYFSSLSARRSFVAYILPNSYSMFLVNADDESFKNVCSGWSVHKIDIKDEDSRRDFDKLCEFLKIDRTKLFRIDTRRFLKKLKDAKWNIDKIDAKEEHGIYYEMVFEKIRRKWIRFDIIGPVLDHHLDIIIADVEQQFKDHEVDKLKDKFHYECFLNFGEINNGLLVKRIYIKDFVDASGNPVEVVDENLYFNAILFDGLNCPSCKEFIKKEPDSEFKIMAWSDNGELFKYMTVFESAALRIRSIKPHIHVFLKTGVRNES